MTSSIKCSRIAGRDLANDALRIRFTALFLCQNESYLRLSMRNVGIDVPPKPWTGITVKALRDEIARGGDEIFGLSYQVVYLWYSRVLLSVVEELNGLEYHRVLDENPVISFRVKTVDTLRDKLMRQDSTPLFRIHDIIGARVTANMTLQQQNELVRIIAAYFPKCRVSDLRHHPHTGYRAVHVICRLQRVIFVEIQVRTLLQDGWANCFEAISDRYGRGIRYGEFPVDEDASRVVNEMMELSRACRDSEERLYSSSLGSRVSAHNRIYDAVSRLRQAENYLQTPHLERFSEMIGECIDVLQLSGEQGGAHGWNDNQIQPENRR